MKFKIIGQEITSSEQDTSALQPKKSYLLGLSRSIEEELEPITIDDDEIVALHFADQTSWLLTPEDLEDIFSTQQREGNKAGVIEISDRIKTGSNDRGLGDLIIKVLEIFSAPAAELTAEWVANNVENKIVPKEGLFQLNKDFELNPYVDDQIVVNPNQDPVLLLIHGTCSNTQGSFGHLKDSHLWISLWQKYSGRVVAFEHRTLTKSPVENLLDIIPALPPGVPVHLITHSRGGLVGDLLARCAAGGASFSETEIASFENTNNTAEIARLKEANKLADEHKIAIEKYVRVACPSQGTRLMTERLDLFLNIVLNLMLKASGGDLLPPLVAIKKLLLNVIKQRANPDVLPGLEAMKPDTPFQRLLNSPREAIESELNIIAGDARTGKWKQTLAFFVSRLLFWGDNDFVVDTDAMYSGFRRREATYYHLFSGGDVHHFSYFRNPSSQQAILNALTAEPGTAPKGFIQVGGAPKDIQRGVLFPNGEITPKVPDPEKPLVVLVPGFMGSNLAWDDQEIWINYGKMLTGSLLHLSMKNNEDITAPSLVGTPYKALVRYLEKANYTVLVAPYDWRLSTHSAGLALAEKLTEIEKGHQRSIQIIAHSMGGLVVREMLMLDKKKYPVVKKLQNQPDFRVILMGTPWRGTYVVPQTLVGQGTTIRTLGRLSYREGKKALLKVMSKYPGLYELMPQEGHSFEDKALWDSFWKITNQNDWVLPGAAERKIHRDHKQKISKKLPELDLSKFIYVAGQDRETVDNLIINNTKTNNDYFATEDTGEFKNYVQDNDGKKLRLAFTTTNEGDGTVTWELGIPKRLLAQNKVYYQPTVHGELANDKNYFPALLELLQTGKTTELQAFKEAKAQQVSRAMGRKETVLARPAALADTDAGMIAEILGMRSERRYQSAKRSAAAINVTIKAGHLKYAKHPILVGHFQEDGIISAEYIIDVLLERELTKRYRLGNYPGQEKTNLVLLADEDRVIGTIVAGLGSPEDLSSLNLTQTIHHACLRYVLQWAENPKNKDRTLGVTSLLIGSGYGNLPISASINAILEAVALTNRKIEELRREADQMALNDNNIYFNRDTWELALIEEVEFIEIYRDKALKAFYVLDQIERENNIYPIRFDRKLPEAQGSRDTLPLAEEKDWWMRLAVRYEEDTTPGFHYTASTGQARVSIRNSNVDQDTINTVLQASDHKRDWNRSLSKTLYELLVPNDFKQSFRNQKNILLVLDNKTAAYPWELLHFDEESGDPLCVRTGFIRQLSTNNDTPVVKPIHQNKALVIGDPTLTGDFPQLAGAKEEAMLVNQLLNSKNYEVDLLIRKSSIYILNKFFEEYKVIHVASHGVVNYDINGKKKTGILLDNDIVLDPAIIKQRTNTPELVFINCCHLGDVDKEREELSQSRYKLAANVGTQFINMGVKAVVVAGWAVEDEAAKVFAEVFYQKMLQGYTFGYAVKEARAQCYRRFPKTHTWGAYQCYGDQFFTLAPRSKKSNEEEYSYLLAQEVIIDLEKLLDDTRSVRKRRDPLLERLEKIVEAAQVRHLDDPKIVELAAQAYKELGVYQKSAQAYQSLWSNDKTNWSIKSLEQYCNAKMAALWQELNDKNSKRKYEDIYEDMKVVVQRIEGLIDMGETVERYNLLGSAHKRCFMTAKIEEDRREHLDKALQNYGLARAKAAKPDHKDHYYALCNWLEIAVLESGNEEAIMAALLDKSPKDYFTDHLKEMEGEISNRSKFWDEIKLVNIYTTLLLAEKILEEEIEETKGKKKRNKEEELKEIERRMSLVKEALELNEEEIRKHYFRAWKTGGSLGNRLSEVFQMSFLLEVLEFTMKEDIQLRPLQKQSLQRLCHFFSELK